MEVSLTQGRGIHVRGIASCVATQVQNVVNRKRDSECSAEASNASMNQC
jgi:hypothetical protein